MHRGTANLVLAWFHLRVINAYSNQNYTAVSESLLPDPYDGEPEDVESESVVEAAEDKDSESLSSPSDELLDS